jgi:hypothetical protein
MRFVGDLESLKRLDGKCVVVDRWGKDEWRVVGSWFKGDEPMNEIDFRSALAGDVFELVDLKAFVRRGRLALNTAVSSSV